MIVPFSVSADVEDLQSGGLEFQGSVAFEDDGLELRYHMQTHSMTRGEEGSLRVDLNQMAGIDFKRRWFGGCTMTLRASRIDAFAGVPFARAGRMVLSIPRRHRQDAIDFMATVQTRIDFASKR